MSYVINVDVGTGSGRAILFDEVGTALAVSQREWLPKTDDRYPGAQDFDTDEAWSLLCSCIREVLNAQPGASESLLAITATSMREGMVLYDKGLKEIWACPNVDGRAQDEAAEMIKKGLADRIYESGGDWLSIISPPRFWWIKRHEPELYKKIAHVTMLSDWVLFKLTGKLVTDPSIGSSSGIFDLKTRRWARDVIKEAGLPEGIYPEVMESGTIMGHVSDAAATATGLKAGTPVVTGGADTQLALVGAAAVEAGVFTICGGTFWQTTVLTDTPLIDPDRRPRTLCHGVPGLWMTEGIGFYHGFVMRWFRDGFCHAEVADAAQRGIDAYAAMEEIASDIPPGSNGIQGIFSNIMEAKRWRHGPPSFIGFDVLQPAATGKAACVRAIEENAAYVSRGTLDILYELSGFDPEELILVGGASKGELWPQIVADVANKPVRIPTVKETTSLGGAIAALVATEVYPDWTSAIERVVTWERTVQPDPQNVAAYDSAYETWKATHDHMLTLADRGVLPSLWRAPGV